MLVQPGGAPPALLNSIGRYGFRVVVAASAEAALDVAGRFPFRAVVTTYRLSGRSGVWLFEQVRQLQPNAQRVLVVDDPRLDIARLLKRGICHTWVDAPLQAGRLLDRLAGVPDRAPEEATPVVDLDLHRHPAA